MAPLHVVIDVPQALHASAAGLWRQVLGWPVGDPWSGHPELSSFEPPDGAPYVHLQRVDGPSGVHIDLETRDPEATVLLARELGATPVAAHDRWWSMASPGGLPFCVLREEYAGAQVPGPVTWPGGHRSRLVQVCIDSPAEIHEDEVEFWRALLGERWVGSDAPEFAGKWYDDDGGPLQLLFQRLDEESGPVRAHLDLGADVIAVEVLRLRRLGMSDLGAGRGWHVLRDPLGEVFCVTGNAP